MISRRILRIKVLQSIYAYYQGGGSELVKAQRSLRESIDRSYDLYFYLMLLAIEVCDYAGKQIDAAMQKFLPTDVDRNPNMKFVNNKFIEQLRSNKALQGHLAARKLSWVNFKHVPKAIFNELSETDEYKSYMVNPDQSYADDKDIISFMLENIVVENEDFYDALETQSIYWVDTAEFFVGMALRTISRFKESYGEDHPLMKKFKSDDDGEFADKLLVKSIASGDRYRELITQSTENWDFERIALLDILLIQEALAEIEQFPGIPLRVTFNEYIEIAKNYSTEKSPIFINGVLDKIVQKLRESGELIKSADVPVDDDSFL